MTRIVDERLFTKVREAVNARRTRVPGRRDLEDGDVFVLRRLLRCIRCDRLMTTSSSRVLPEVPKPTKTKPSRRKIVMPPRYYRCRGQRACRGTQVSAEGIEQRVLAWLRKPTGEISSAAKVVVAQLVWEVRWDGPKNSFTVVLDEFFLLEDTRGKLLAGIAASRKAPPPKPTEHWAVADRYAGIEHAQLVVNVHDESDRKKGEQLVADLVRLRKDETLFNDILGLRGSKIPVSAVVANPMDARDAGRKKAIARVRRALRTRSP